MKDKFTALEGFIFIAISLSSLIAIFTPITYLISWVLGLVCASLFGLMFGSFATSLTARIPKRIFFIKEDPYCMSCKNHLRTRDLYTVFSYIYNKGICRFCKSAIPIAIFYTEFIICLIYILCYLLYGFGMKYIISTTFLSMLTISIIIYLNDRFISYIMIFSTVILGLYWFIS